MPMLRCNARVDEESRRDDVEVKARERKAALDLERLLAANLSIACVSMGFVSTIDDE